jgi:hypothetical protein
LLLFLVALGFEFGLTLAKQVFLPLEPLHQHQAVYLLKEEMNGMRSGIHPRQVSPKLQSKLFYSVSAE